MNSLFANNYSYDTTDSADLTKKKFEELFNRGWLEDSQNVAGKIDAEGAFVFRSRYSPFSFSTWQRVTYLRGYIVETDSGSTINIRLSSNIGLVFILFLFPLVAINVLFGDNSLMGGKRWNNIIILLCFELFIFLVLKLNSFVLKKKFEKVMGL
jgi:hypothetical protein